MSFASVFLIIISFDDFRFLGCELVEFFVSIELNPVIWLEDADIFSVSFFQALVHAVAITGIRLVDDDDTAIALRIFGEDFPRIISRAIVDTNNFEFAKSLVD